MSSPIQTKRSSFVSSQESENKDPASNSENEYAVLNRIARNMPPLSRILDDAKRQLHFLKATLETLQRNNDESELMKGVLIKYVKQALNGPLTATPNDIHVFFYYYGGGEIGVIFFSEKERYTQWKSFQTSAFGKQAFNLSRQIYCLLFTTDNSIQVNKLINNEVHEETKTLSKSSDKVNQNGAKMNYADPPMLSKTDYNNSDIIAEDNDCVHLDNHIPSTAVSSAICQKINDHDVNQPSPTPSSHNESSETVSSMSPDRGEKEIITSHFSASQSNLFEIAECADEISKNPDTNLDNCDSQSDSKVSYGDNLDSRFEVIMEDSLGEVPLNQFDGTEPSFVSPLKFSINLRDSNQGESNNGTELEYEPLKYLATEKMVEMPLKRKRGRPRKHPLPGPQLEPNRNLSEPHALFNSNDQIASSERRLINFHENPYCCKVCSKTFPDYSLLRRHDRNHHNKLGESFGKK